MARKAGYYWVKYVSRNDWSIEYWNGGMWFTRNPTLVNDNWFATIDETPIVRGQKETNEESNCNIHEVSISFLNGGKTIIKKKTYYVECTVSFTDNSEEEPWKSSETYSYIIEANNKKEGKADAEKQAKEELERELGKMDDVKVVIDTFYQTFEGARAN